MALVQEAGLTVRRSNFDPEMSFVAMRVGVPDEAWGPERPDKRWSPGTRSFTMVNICFSRWGSSPNPRSARAIVVYIQSGCTSG